MANEHNLIPFDKRTESEQRRIRSAGGKASGETRRKKADFKRTLNALLTAQIDSPEWNPVLEALGLDPTLESAVNAAMIKEALSGNVRAYEAIARYSGQGAETEADVREQEAKIRSAELDNAEKEKRTASDESGGLASVIMEAYEKRKRGDDV